MLHLFAKNLGCGPDSRVIFLIFIITLYLHDPSVNGYDYNTIPNRLIITARSCHKSVIIK
jgi:hypothetical protein